MSKADDQWWNNFFEDFRPLFSVIPPKTTNAEVKYLIEKLNLSQGKSFLDCPCGIGRISIPMAKKGIEVTGVDITGSYLAELEEISFRKNLPIKLFHTDMRKIDFENEFDAAANLCTSFGYFEKQSEDLLTLKKIFKALKPGGRFCLHIVNRDWIMKNYEDRGWSWVGDIKILEERQFDYATSVNSGTWYFIKDGKESKYNVSVRLYSYHELIPMFEKVGFVDIEGFSSTKDEKISRDQRMMFIFGKKPSKRKARKK